ncbi:Reticulon [Pelomyxa schiedti]|nr:Reticulon [Pelomyxa schiedti]
MSSETGCCPGKLYDLFSWKCRITSATVVGLATTTWILTNWCRLSVLTFTSFVLLALMVAFSAHVYATMFFETHIIGRKPENPFKDAQAPSISCDVGEVSESIANFINFWIAEITNMLHYTNPKTTLKCVAGLIFTMLVGKCVSGCTFVYLAVLLPFILLPLYIKHGETALCCINRIHARIGTLCPAVCPAPQKVDEHKKSD